MPLLIDLPAPETRNDLSSPADSHDHNHEVESHIRQCRLCTDLAQLVKEINRSPRGRNQWTFGKTR